MKVSTLQNYYKRRDICPTPRKAQLIKIAEHEGVSLDWLLDGTGKEPDIKDKKNDINEGRRGGSSPHVMSSADKKILELFSFLSEGE